MAKARSASQAASRSKQARKPNSLKSAKTEHARPDESEGTVPLELQQKCLTIFRDALRPSADDVAVLQEVKGHLYNRDFAAAFAKEEYLRVYASRWSPSRALGYVRVLADIQDHLLPDDELARLGQSDQESLEIVCLGGGAGAEVIALGGWWSVVTRSMPKIALQARFVDIAAWNDTVETLHKQCVTAPEISKYASAAAREANRPMLSGDAFSCHFHQQDVLDWPENVVHTVITPTTKLVTLFFTLNELYSASIPKTQHLLSQLTAALPANGFLLVVDSPGSYSTVSINGAERKYPMQWLLDHTLLSDSQQKAGIETAARWEKVVSDESRWFRLPLGLEYPIELENMRYQMHLYRRLATKGDG
ncbi:hypothetical protein B0A55_01036 [Friedmanniomyces simplex]|uniref:25S rRNA (Uridine(2843)-N(3))-methyltransferase n=1 Tax=Friedmanniomyces simplex TaxID=329884 RepID=A0A4U0Y561_9PEZI|nr:hypothetical protein B0A55_01036 [Friedmanniomyces simplex]